MSFMICFRRQAEGPVGAGMLYISSVGERSGGRGIKSDTSVWTRRERHSVSRRVPSSVPPVNNGLPAEEEWLSTDVIVQESSH